MGWGSVTKLRAPPRLGWRYSRRRWASKGNVGCGQREDVSSAWGLSRSALLLPCTALRGPVGGPKCSARNDGRRRSGPQHTAVECPLLRDNAPHRPSRLACVQRQARGLNQAEYRKAATDFMDASPDHAPDASAARKEAKKQLRALCRQRRDELGEDYRQRASERICDSIQEWPAFRSARVVFAYLPIKGELDLRPLIAGSPETQWAIPRIVRTPERRLAFHRVSPRPPHPTPVRHARAGSCAARDRSGPGRPDPRARPGLHAQRLPAGLRWRVLRSPAWQRPAVRSRSAPATWCRSSTTSLTTFTTSPWATW